MRILLRNGALCAVTAAWVLCVAPGCTLFHPALKPEVVSKITSTDVLMLMPQAEVNAAFIRSDYADAGALLGGPAVGLIGAAIDAGVNSSRRQRAEHRVQELREQLKDVDFRGLYCDAISNSVAGAAWLKPSRFAVVTTNARPRVSKDMVARQAVLNVGTDYYIAGNGRALVVLTGLAFFPQAQHKKAAASTLIAYHSAEISQADAEQAMVLWTADHAAAFRKSAEEAIRESARMVTYALQLMAGESNASSPTLKIRAELMHRAKPNPITMPGTIIEDRSDRIIFRNTSGWLYSLPRGEVEVK